jgi:HlyD family secretion protein
VVTYTVVITVNNAELKLKPGMTANVTIDVARADNVLTVPTRALRFQPTSDNGSSPATGQKEKPVKGERLYLLTADATLRAVPVQTGLSGDSKVEVTSDKLKEGDQVVLEELGDKKKAKKAMGSGTGPRF